MKSLLELPIPRCRPQPLSPLDGHRSLKQMVVLGLVHLESSRQMEGTRPTKIVDWPKLIYYNEAAVVWEPETQDLKLISLA